MALTFVTGIKLIGGISLIMALILLGGSSWVFGTQMVDLDHKLNSSGLPYPKRDSPPHSIEHNYTTTLKELKSIWQKNQPILSTCSAIAIFAGFSQLTISLLIVFSDSKNVRRRARIWITTHFVLFLVLLICLLSAFLMRLNHVDMKSWSEILDSFADSLKRLEPKTDFSRILNFLGVDLPLFYSVVGSDLISVIILFIVGICVMHKYHDYEPQE